MGSVLLQLDREMGELVEGASKSLVQVRNSRGGAGAGSVWQANGLVITNAHVIHDERPTVVLSDGREFSARVLARSKTHDIAALSIDAHDLASIPIGNSLDVEAGQWVMAIGHPWGMVNAATAGVIIGLESEFPDGGPGEHKEGKQWLAVNLPLRPGNSGGPLIDTEGRLIGINTMMSGPDIGMAVPVHEVKRFLDRELKITA
ncbi:MAG: trypsin-like peptidase domain-containing protein [Chloroflexi bacterium]|nr:trypsin-like peptidase domain-containing protein [Chloroflexota bacterium]